MKVSEFVRVCSVLLISASAVAAAEERSPVVSPESVGLSSQALRSIVDKVKGWVEDQEVVGAEILILKNRKVVLHEAVGLMDLEEQRPLKLNTIACVRSMTKPVVGTAIQMLVDEGKLGLDDKVGKHLASFAKGKSGEITVRQMLTHTGGFPLTLIDRPLSGYERQREVADQAGSIGPKGKPGERFSYSDCDTEVLAALVSQLSGMPVEEFIQKRILTPLGMSDTYCVLRRDAPDRSRVSSNHMGGTGLWHRYWSDDDPPFFPFFLGAAAMYSTPVDYAKFVALWVDRGMVGKQRFLSNDAIDRGLQPAVPMLAPALDMKLKIPQPTGLAGTVVYYGQHWMIYRGEKDLAPGVPPIFGHGGSDGTGAWVFPEQDLMALYFSQSRNGMTVFRFEELLSTLAGLPAPATSAYGGDRLPAEALKPYVGAYRNTKSGSTVYVARWGHRLGIELMGSGCSVLRWPDSSGRWGLESPSVAVRFLKDAAGVITGLSVIERERESSFQRIHGEPEWPTVDQLMAERRRLQGGERIDDLKGLSMEGTFDVGAAKSVGETKVLVGGPDRLARRASVKGKPAETTIVDHGRAWRSVADQPFQELKGLFYEQAVLSNPLLRLGDWRNCYETVEIIGKDKVGKEDVWVVWTRPRSYPSSTKYVSIRTGLLLKEDTWITVKSIGTIPFSIAYDDYREVAGVRLPFRITSESAATSHQVGQFNRSAANPDFPANAFSVPERGR